MKGGVRYGILTFCLCGPQMPFTEIIRKEEERKIFRVNISVANWVILKLGLFKLVFSLGRQTT